MDDRIPSYAKAALVEVVKSSPPNHNTHDYNDCNQHVRNEAEDNFFGKNLLLSVQFGIEWKEEELQGKCKDFHDERHESTNSSSEWSHCNKVYDECHTYEKLQTIWYKARGLEYGEE